MGSERKEDYRYLAACRTGFVQQVVTNYLSRGYHFFVTGKVPERKEATAVDAKMLDLYDVRQTSSLRYGRKKRGLANVQYIRFENDWLMLATEGEHDWFAKEHDNIRDARKVPIEFQGYSMSVRRGLYTPHRLKADRDGPPEREFAKRVRVLIARKSYRDLRNNILDASKRRDASIVAGMFWNIPFEPYAPIRQQFLKLLCQVNSRRKRAGLTKIDHKCLRLRRNIVKVFVEPMAELAMAS